MRYFKNSIMRFIGWWNLLILILSFSISLFSWFSLRLALACSLALASSDRLSWTKVLSRHFIPRTRTIWPLLAYHRNVVCDRHRLGFTDDFSLLDCQIFDAVQVKLEPRIARSPPLDLQEFSRLFLLQARRRLRPYILADSVFFKRLPEITTLLMLFTPSLDKLV